MQTVYAQLEDVRMYLGEAGIRQGTKALQDSSRRAGRRLGKELDLALKLARPILPVCPLAYKMS